MLHRQFKEKKYIIKNRDLIVFPTKKIEIFLDLEGIDPSTVEDEIIQIDYLIGILIRNNSNEIYKSFVANNLDDEKKMLYEFLDFIQKQEDFVIYHYHNYEKTHLSKMMIKYAVPIEIRNLVLDNMIDIYKVAIAAVAFPTYGNGLKYIAKFLGFKWKHKDVDATESIVFYLDYIADPINNKDKLDLILDYNKDDCVATKIIKDWLETVRTSNTGTP